MIQNKKNHRPFCPTLHGFGIRAFFILLLFCTSGCAVVTFVDLATSGREGKQKSLSERVEKFHRELYWNTGTQFAQYIEQTKRPDLIRRIRQGNQVERLVNVEVSNMELDDLDSDLAQVEVKVRFYKKASLMVSERFEKETWEYFRLRGGWFLIKREVSPTDGVSSDEEENLS